MNYYSFHIGDYRGATAHLSNEEDLAYRRLLDMCYDSESAIPLETDWVARRLRVATSVVESVLNDFFEKTEEGWINPRCAAAIAEYRKRASRNRENGKKGGRRKLLSASKKNPTGSQLEPAAIPVQTERPPTAKATKNQEPITKNPPTNAEALVCPPESRPAPKTTQTKDGQRRAKALPEGWEPAPGHRELATTLGVSLDAELPQFRDHHTAKRSLMADWDAAFRTWLRNAAKWAGAAAKAGKAPKVAYLPAEQWETTGVDAWGLPIHPPKNGGPPSYFDGHTNASAAPRHAPLTDDSEESGKRK